MAKLRRIPTSMTSGTRLVAALEQSGLREIERVPDLAPLISWRGQPLSECAEIIVRRRSIGATADDLGFVRDAEGRYEAIVSEILLSRFDKRWFAELEKRYAALAGLADAPAQAPRVAESPREERAPELAPPQAQRPEVASPAKPEPRLGPRLDSAAERAAPLPAPSRGTIEVDQVDIPALAGTSATVDADSKVEADLVAVLGAAKRAGGGAGCAKYVLLFVLFYGLSAAMRQPAVLVLGIIGLVLYAIRDVKQRKQRMVQAASAEFRARFGSRAEARELALQRLRREIGKLDGDKRAVVEQLLRRVS